MPFQTFTMVLACFFNGLLYIYHDNITVLNIYSGLAMFLNMSHNNTMILDITIYLFIIVFGRTIEMPPPW